MSTPSPARSAPTATSATRSRSAASSPTASTATVTCQINNGAFNPCASPLSLVDLPYGPTSLTIRASDAAGNVGLETDKGSGIGLSLVREHVGLHGGRVWVEEREGGGARFVVRLPVVS